MTQQHTLVRQKAIFNRTGVILAGNNGLLLAGKHERAPFMVTAQHVPMNSRRDFIHHQWRVYLPVRGALTLVFGGVKVLCPERHALRLPPGEAMGYATLDCDLLMFDIDTKAVKSEVFEEPPLFDTREDPWWMKNMLPNSACEVALGEHPAGYYNPKHYQKTQSEALILLEGKIRFGQFSLQGGDMIETPPCVVDDEEVPSDAGPILQLVIKTPMAGRSDKVLVGSSEDAEFRASGIPVYDSFWPPPSPP